MSEITVVLNSEGVPTENRVMSGNLFVGVVGDYDGVQLKTSCAIAGNFNLKSLLSIKAQLTQLLGKIEEGISHEAFNIPVGLCVAIPMLGDDCEETGNEPTACPEFVTMEGDNGNP